MMKKILLASLLLLAAIPAMADNYFTLGENDTLWVDPKKVGRFFDFPVRAHFDGRLDYWQINFSMPNEFDYITMGARSGMTVPYVNAMGRDTTYNALLTHNTLDGLSASSQITILGYWDYNEDGIYEPYGTVKWEAGDYSEMFEMNIAIASGFTGGVITLTGEVNSGSDSRGGTVSTGTPVQFSRTITVKVGYHRGDVDGDGNVSMDDLVALNYYLLNGTGLDAYQLEAADLNGNGTVGMEDLAILISILLTNGTMNLDELDALFNGSPQES